LAFLLSAPERRTSLTELAERLGIPFPTVHREVDRAERAGLVSSAKTGNVRLVRANTESPYFEGLADVLVKAFGPPQVIAEEFAGIPAVEEVIVFGSWAARYAGTPGERPVGDIDTLVLGDPDPDLVYEAAARAARRLGREVQVTIREPGWLDAGEGSFHDTVVGRPLLRVLPERSLVTQTPRADRRRAASAHH
jgi:predicted nucleotidyltransferase